MLLQIEIIVEPKWIDIWWVNFNEVPRRIWFVYDDDTYQLESAFDKKTGYSPFYTISVKDEEDKEYREIFAIPVSGVLFDDSKMKMLDVSIIDKLIR